MNVNDMIDTILNFDLDVVLAGLNESSHHLSQMEFVSLIVITVGAVLLCLTGLKLVRFWSVIAGLSAGCAAGIAVGVIAGLDQMISLAAGAGVGLVLAVLGAWKKQIGGFVTVAVLVFVVSVHLMKPQDFIMYGICAGIGLVCALLSIKFHNFMLIASSSVFGAMAAGSSIFYLQPYKNGMIHVALCVAIGVLSIWIQLLLNPENVRKRIYLKLQRSVKNILQKMKSRRQGHWLRIWMILMSWMRLSRVFRKMSGKKTRAQQLSAWMNLMILKMIWKRMKWRTLKKRSLM